MSWLSEKSSQGESFYNPYIPPVLEELTNKGLVKDDKGARVIVIKDQLSPLIVVKRDGGFNYASTDLAALWSVMFLCDICQQFYPIALAIHKFTRHCPSFFMNSGSVSFPPLVKVPA